MPQSLPLLVEDGSRADWHRAAYQVEVQVGPTRAQLTHMLNEAPTLSRLVADGAATWATELRCPRTLHSRVEVTPRRSQVVSWNRGEVDGDVFILPGLLALEQISLRPEPGELAPIWGEEECVVPRGWWLARGTARRGKTLGQSLLQFRQDRNLDAGRMRIEPDLSGDELRFHVQLAKDLWPERRNRHLQVGALIGALARLGTTLQTDDGEPEPRVATEIRQRLVAAGVSAWDDDTADFDPALAATVIEPFLPIAQPDRE